MAGKRKPRRYNVRDLLGHWVKPKSERGKMCPHACCRGKRVHPANFPVILPRQLLREATDQQLADHYGKHSHNGNARRQIEAEMNRRDRVEANRKRAAERSRSRRFTRAEDYDRRWLAAERATNGNMLNTRGRRAGVSERRVLSNARDLERYGSDELKAHIAAVRRRNTGRSA